MSNVYTPESPTLKSSPALPRLQVCIETVIHEAVLSGRQEEPVRQFLRLQASHFEGVLQALHNAYYFASAPAAAASNESGESSDPPQRSLLLAGEIIDKRSDAQKAQEQEEEEEEEDGMLSESELQQYVQNHPGTAFVRQGNRRYMLLTSHFGEHMPTFNQAYVNRHPHETFEHLGSFRYCRRGAGLAAGISASSNALQDVLRG